MRAGWAPAHAWLVTKSATSRMSGRKCNWRTEDDQAKQKIGASSKSQVFNVPVSLSYWQREPFHISLIVCRHGSLRTTSTARMRAIAG